MNARRLLLSFVLTALLAACGDDDGGVPSEVVLQGDGVVVRLAGTPPVLTITRADGEVVLEELPADDPSAIHGPAGIQDGEVTQPRVLSSWFFPEVAVGPWRRPIAIRSVARSDDRVEAILSLPARVLPDGASGADREIRFTAEAVGEGAVRIRYEPVLEDGEQLTDLRLFASQSFRCGADERFYGLGHRPDSPEHRGHTRYHWTEEGGIGLGPGAPLGPRNPLPNGPSTTYFPIPYYVSSEGYALQLDSTARSLFELCSEREDAIRLETWEPAIGITVIVGDRGADDTVDPLQVLERASAVLGRPEPPPRWIFAPWNDAVEGSGEVRRVAAVLRDNEIPSSVIWSEDWAGSDPTDTGITLVPDGWIDREVYPDVEIVADELHDQGFRFLSYYYPYLIEGTEDHDTARREGYLLRDANGEELRFFCVRDIVGQPDLSHPPAREWMKDRLRRSLDLGFDGWMADFAEYTPFTALASDGTPGSLLHNQFPVQWQELNREVLEEARPDGDWGLLRALRLQRFPPDPERGLGRRPEHELRAPGRAPLRDRRGPRPRDLRDPLLRPRHRGLPLVHDRDLRSRALPPLGGRGRGEPGHAHPPRLQLRPQLVLRPRRGDPRGLQAAGPAPHGPQPLPRDARRGLGRARPPPSCGISSCTTPRTGRRGRSTTSSSSGPTSWPPR